MPITSKTLPNGRIQAEASTTDGECFKGVGPTLYDALLSVHEKVEDRADRKGCEVLFALLSEIDDALEPECDKAFEAYTVAQFGF